MRRGSPGRVVRSVDKEEPPEATLTSAHGWETTDMARTEPAVPSETRFARVRAILDAAAAGSRADYGGVGRFWERNLAEFLETSGSRR